MIEREREEYFHDEFDLITEELSFTILL